VPNVTSHRVLTKDRAFVEELHFKGWKLRIADWVHLANPDEPSRPIIGQIFRCWLSDEYATVVFFLLLLRCYLTENHVHTSRSHGTIDPSRWVRGVLAAVGTF